MNWLALVVAIWVWLTPSPRHAQGLLVRYGPQWLVEQVAEYRGYDLSPYSDRCGVSLISPSDLGRVVWIKQADGSWYGPCLAMDAAAREHFAWIVYNNWEVAEVPNFLAEKMGFCCGQMGEIFIGICPPVDSTPEFYRPPKIWETDPGTVTPSMYPYPAQVFPGEC